MGVLAKGEILSVRKESALSVHERERTEQLLATKSWAQNFVSRQKLQSRALHGQAGSVDTEKVADEINQTRETLRS